MQEIFAWTGVGEYGVYIRADRGDPNADRFYLNMSDKRGFAVVTRDTGAKFDIFPAETAGKSTYYVLSLNEKYVRFNVAKKQLVLQDQITNMCLFAKSPPAPIRGAGKPTTWKQWKSMRMTIENKGRVSNKEGQFPKCQLKIGEPMLSTGREEWPGVSVVDYPVGNGDKVWISSIYEL